MSDNTTNDAEQPQPTQFVAITQTPPLHVRMCEISGDGREDWFTGYIVGWQSYVNDEMEWAPIFVGRNDGYFGLAYAENGLVRWQPVGDDWT